MSEQSPPALSVSEAEARFARLFIVWFIVILGLAAGGTMIYGFIVVGNVRDTARRTDSALRAVAWSSMAYACANDGAFPTRASDLTSFDVPDSIDCASSDDAWPTQKTGVRGRHETLPTITDALGAEAGLEVTFDPEGLRPPVIDPAGNPTMLGTLEDVAAWLVAIGDDFALRREDRERDSFGRDASASDDTD